MLGFSSSGERVQGLLTEADGLLVHLSEREELKTDLDMLSTLSKACPAWGLETRSLDSGARLGQNHSDPSQCLNLEIFRYKTLQAVFDGQIVLNEPAVVYFLDF